MSRIDSERRDVALARVQAVHALDGDFRGAVQSVADDMELSRRSVLRWAHRQFDGDLAKGEGGPRPAQVLGAHPIRAVVLQLLRDYETANGMSADDYAEEPQVHPMAEGKYLSTLATLYRTGILTRITDSLNESLTRLEQTAVSHGTGIAWGLGFSFRNAPTKEPYVITTCIIVTALFEALEFADAHQRTRVSHLISEAVAWLETGARRESWMGLKVPTFSESIPEVVFNVVAQWSFVLAQAKNFGFLPRGGESRIRAHSAAAAAILDQFRPNVGWTYGEQSTRLDLLHTCYIGNALLTALPDRREQIDRALLVGTTHFLSPHGWFDRFDLLDTDTALKRPWPWNGRTHRFLDEGVLLGFDRPARVWSIGELMVLAAASSEYGATSKFWATQLRPLATLAVGRHAGSKQFRHSMHLAHGLAATLEALRRKRTSEKE